MYRWLANGKIILLLFALVALFSFYLFPFFSAGYRLPDDPDVINLQMSFTKVQFTQVVETWMLYRGIQALDAFRKTLLVLDIAFPVIYAFLLSGLYAWLALRSGEAVGGLQRLIFSLPYAAGLMDLIENSIHYSLLSKVQQPADLAGLSGGMIFAASFFASVKFILIGLSFLVSLFYAGRLIMRFLSRR